MKRFYAAFILILACICFGCSSAQKTEEAEVVFEEADFSSPQPPEASAAEEPQDADIAFESDNDNRESEYNDESFSEKEDESYYYYRVGSFRGEGDCLASIARKYYNDTNKWHKIYDANSDQLSDPNVVRQGILLKIPKE